MTISNVEHLQRFEQLRCTLSNVSDDETERSQAAAPARAWSSFVTP
ncbi:hypothetical protein [Deinococcus detaillensis]|nr:hypothetical protein [Deinococcus detaillensis]